MKSYFGTVTHHIYRTHLRVRSWMPPLRLTFELYLNYSFQSIRPGGAHARPEPLKPAGPGRARLHRRAADAPLRGGHDAAAAAKARERPAQLRLAVPRGGIARAARADRGPGDEAFWPPPGADRLSPDRGRPDRGA